MFLQQMINGLGIGCTYALIALGYNLIFGVLKVVNLAYGEIFMVSAFVGLAASIFISANPFLVFTAAIAGAVITGLLIHIFAVKPLGNVSNLDSPRHLSVLVSTMACSLILHNLVLEVFGAYPQRFPRLIPDWHLTLLSIHMDGAIILNLAVSLIVMIALSLFLNHTLVGLRIRALSENKELALCNGIHTTKDEFLSVILSSGLAGLAAILISQVIGSISPFSGLSYGFKGLVVLIVGGVGNMTGAVVIALLLGLSEVLAVAYFSSSYRDAVAFSVLIILLIGKAYLRPLTEHR